MDKDQELAKKTWDIINAFSPISLSTYEQMMRIMSFEVVPKGVFIKKGKASSKEYIIIEGVLRTYVESSNNKEVTLNFYTKGCVLSPTKTRLINGTSSLYIDAPTEATLAVVDSKGMKEISKQNNEIRLLRVKVLENDLMEKSAKEIMLAALPGKDKLSFFRERFPTLENEIPHSYIASYCGISNVSLSRFRAMKDI